MKRNLTPDQSAQMCRLLRDEFDNCPPRISLAQWQEDAIELTRSMYRLTDMECFLELANQMQSDFELDYPSASDDYDPNWQENASERDLQSRNNGTYYI